MAPNVNIIQSDNGGYIVYSGGDTYVFTSYHEILVYINGVFNPKATAPNIPIGFGLSTGIGSGTLSPTGTAVPNLPTSQPSGNGTWTFPQPPQQVPVKW